MGSMRQTINLMSALKLLLNGGAKRLTEIKTTNRLKQGAIHSPILFTIYIDVSFLSLKKAGFGFHTGIVYTGCISCADCFDGSNIVFLEALLKNLLFSKEFYIDFNVNKYKLLNLSPSNDSGIDGLYFHGNYIKCTTVAKHLGHCISQGYGEMSMFDAVNSLTVNTNDTVSIFGSAYTHAKYHLFKSFAIS